MIVLQLGANNWQNRYKIPADIEWVFNDPDYFDHLPKPKKEKGKRTPKQQKFFNLVIISSPVSLTDEVWEKLQWKVDPYRVIYVPEVINRLSPAGEKFLELNQGRISSSDPQIIIDDINRKYYAEEYGGFKMAPSRLIINQRLVKGEFKYPDPGHFTTRINSPLWQTLANYRDNWYIAPGKQMKIWLEFEQDIDVEIRFRIFLNDGTNQHRYIIDLKNHSEPVIPIPVQDYGQFASVAIEVRGVGELTLGYVHGRWTRYGVGHYIPGGKRLVDPINNEEIPYYFNPGDGKPPLNVYFAGVNLNEMFEGKNLMRRLHAPSICFFDPRLSLGEFFVSDNLQKQIAKLIKQKLADLQFTNQQLVVSGISEGSYAAMRIGAPLEPKAIIMGKLLANLGHIAQRGRLHRPNDFQPSYDIVTRIINNESNIYDLEQLDESYWRSLRECDLTHTKIFVAYMESDDFDNISFNRFADTPAIKASEEFAYQGYPGRHNDNSVAISNWFKERYRQVMRDDFGRKG